MDKIQKFIKDLKELKKDGVLPVDINSFITDFNGDAIVKIKDFVFKKLRELDKNYILEENNLNYEIAMHITSMLEDIVLKDISNTEISMEEELELYDLIINRIK